MLMIMILVDYDEGDDVFDDNATPTCRHSTNTKTESSADSAADVDRSKYHLSLIHI